MKTIVLICFCTALLTPAYSQESKNFTFQKPDGTEIYGTYEINNGGYFIRGKQGTLRFHFIDDAYRVEFVNDNILCNGSIITWTPPMNATSKVIKIKIINKEGGVVINPSFLLTLPIKPNSPPKCIFGDCEATFSKRNDQELIIDLKNYVSDRDGDALTYTWLSKPHSFPQISANGVLTIPKATNATNGSKIGIIGIRDQASSIKFILTIDFRLSPAPPKFIPSTNADGKIVLSDIVFEEGDMLTPFAIKALNQHDNSDASVSISGSSYGLTYSSGMLTGNFNYGVIQNDLPEDQLGTIFTKSLTLVSHNSSGKSEAELIFKIKSKAGPEQMLKYKNKRDSVIAIINIYQSEALKKWNIIFADLNKVKRKQEVIDAIGGGLSGVGGLTVFTTSAPLATVVSGLAIIQSQISGLLKKREKRILTNISTLVKALADTSAPIDIFLSKYKENPEKQAFYIRSQLNKMDSELIAIQSKLSSFRTAIASIKRILPDKT
ncbi:MAG: hypothetical protein AAFX87_10465 [Bacteroidota bacterium]